MSRRFLSSLLALALVPAMVFAAPRRSGSTRAEKEANVPTEQRIGSALKLSAEDFGKGRREKPRFTGAFLVGLAFVDFPDTVPVDATACMKRQTEGATDYFKRYTRGQCWPEFELMGPVYHAPQPLGYYARFDEQCNRIGWTDENEGRARVKALRDATFASVQRYAKKKYAVTAFAAAWQRAPLEKIKDISMLRAKYPVGKEASMMEIQTQGVSQYPDQLFLYQPANAIPWGDPLWPNSALTLSAEGESGTMIHELGHILGAPDTYHAPGIKDGIPGDPVLGVAPGGPTGPLYFRYKYCGLMGPTEYPLVTRPTTLTLAPRWSEASDGRPVGVFIPTQHPNYLLHLEFEPSELGATGHIGKPNEDHPGDIPQQPTTVHGGVIAYLINVTLPDAYMGHPDLCYAYRVDDPMMHGTSGRLAVFGAGAKFDASSNPRNALPCQLPTGVEITFGAQTPDGATIEITPPTKRLAGSQLNQSLLPIVSLKAVDQLLPTSLHGSLDLVYRGEPRLTSYGFVIGPGPHPSVRNQKFSLYHGDRFEGRVLNLRPGATYTVRAYAQSPRGIAYSTEELQVTLPRGVTEVPPLLVNVFDVHALDVGLRYDRIYNNGYLTSATSYTALLTLLSYLRAPFVAGKEVPKDLDAIHVYPNSKSVYPPRMKAFLAARDYCRALAESSGLNANTFTMDFNRRMAKVFKLDLKRRGKEPIVTVDSSTIESQRARIEASLQASLPVLVVRQTEFFSPVSRPLNTCIIDGMKLDETQGETLYHVVYLEGYDREVRMLNRPTGWYPLEVVVDACEGARVLYLAPEKSSR